MPLDPDKKAELHAHLTKIAAGKPVAPIDIGVLTPEQHKDINDGRYAQGLPPLESPTIVYYGKHHYTSRVADGYTIEDMLAQLEHGLSELSCVKVSARMTCLYNPNLRNDGYGSKVNDHIVLELTARKPKAEAYSAIPKGDGKSKFKKQKAPLVRGLKAATSG